MQIPSQGVDKNELFRRMESYSGGDMDWRKGSTFAYVYDAGKEVQEVCKEAYTRYLTHNALDPGVYPSLLKFENEIVAIARDHLNGDNKVVGNFTSGGTESCLLAVKTARDYFRDLRPEIKDPEIIVPVTAHPAFHKAAQYFSLKLVPVAVDSNTFKVDPIAMAQAITPNTVLLIASAVSYAHGVVDPIPEIGQVALKHGLLLHIDACMGGFLLPYFRRLGQSVTDFDFSVPGVTSMSMDLHKYAYCAKGASVVLYQNKTLRKYQIFTCSQWPGYSVINPTMQNSKSGGPLAAAWAVLNFIGDDGYLRMARRTLEATQKIVQGINAIEGIRLMVKPEMNLIAFTSDDFNIFHIVEQMRIRNWYVQPQFGFQDSKENIHLSISQANLDRIDEFLDDLRHAVQYARSQKPIIISDELRNAIVAFKQSNYKDVLFEDVLELSRVNGNPTPNFENANYYHNLNAMPNELIKQVLTNMANELYVPGGHD